MNIDKIEIRINKSTASDILNHLNEASAFFIPPLSETVDIEAYSAKLFNYAERIEAWNEGKLIGLIAIYLNDEKHQTGFITNVSVSPNHYKKGIAKKLMDECIIYARTKKFEQIDLEVHESNDKAIALYKKIGFDEISDSRKMIKMRYNYVE